jgi:hypothetical protein
MTCLLSLKNLALEKTESRENQRCGCDRTILFKRNDLRKGKIFSGSTSLRKIARDEIDGSDAQKKAMSRNNYTEKKEREKAERREEARNEKHDAQVK